MTQQPSVRFVMEDRYLADNAAFQASVTAQNSQFQSSVNTANAAFQSSINTQLMGVPGQNYIINGGMDIWQRGTSFAPIANAGYSADRWQAQANVAPTSRTIQQLALDGAAYGIDDVKYYLRSTINTIGSGVGTRLRHQVEDVSTLAGKQVTLSWYAKSSVEGYHQVLITQYFGTGGSTAVTALNDSTQYYYSTWGRCSVTFTMPSIAGKTIGANNNAIWIDFFQKDVTGHALDITAVQLEVGYNPTTFNRAGGTIAGELSACQRYYFRIWPDAVSQRYGSGMATSTTAGHILINFPTTMRTKPTALEQSGTAAHYGIMNSAGTGVALTAVPTFNTASTQVAHVNAPSTYTAAGNATIMYSNNVLGYLGFSAEF